MWAIGVWTWTGVVKEIERRVVCWETDRSRRMFRGNISSAAELVAFGGGGEPERGTVWVHGVSGTENYKAGYYRMTRLM